MAPTDNPTAAKSEATISKDVDQKMDKELPSNGHVEPGVSIRMGPVDEMDVDPPTANGNVNGKRKARNSITNGKSYKEETSDEDDKPLVRRFVVPWQLSGTLTCHRTNVGERRSKSLNPRTIPTQTSAMCL